MDHVPHSMDMPGPPMQMRMVGHPSSSPAQHFSVSNEHIDLIKQMPTTPEFNTLMVQGNVVGNVESSGGNTGLSPNMMSNHLAHRDAVLMNNIMGQSSSLPVKRKAETEPMVNSSVSMQALFPNKLPARIGADVSSHGFMQPYTPHRRTLPVQPSTVSSGIQVLPVANKKSVPNASMSNKSYVQRGHPAKKQSSQIESASKLRPESSEVVRSKMKDSLASALALAYQKPDNVSNTEKDSTNATITFQMPLEILASQTNSTMSRNIHVSGSEEMTPSKELAAETTTNDSKVLSPNRGRIDVGHPVQEFQYSSMLPDENVQFSDNFFVKDDLLRGNGLSWALDFDMQMREGGKDMQNLAKMELVKEEANGHRDRGPGTILIPEDLACKIEAELFKLFSGVNKKYKEKGRSLLFNLKDRNNPELRERVMSGEISPERLCSMSAEELASKELSEWRMAKAEEMAQMVVLPNTDDVRRLVKKTHKGEYQVEFERDDSIADEVSGGASVLTRPRLRKETRTASHSKGSVKDEGNVAVQKNVSDNKEFSGSLVIPTDGTDLMQGMMVDELKDTEFLPPIVSLDEFMESLDSEPPFENLSADGDGTSASQEEKPKVASSHDFHHSSSTKAVFKTHEVDLTINFSGSPNQNDLRSTTSEAKSIWEGILQLTISSSVTIRGLYQSGEKTSTEEWPPSLEIKGRVKLDAFEKFLQQLPMSRTRAVMILQVALKDNSLEKQRSNLSEVVESYVADERLGFAEPAPGVELYLCPTTSRMGEMLHKHMPKECPDSNVSTENGLIGVVVWRRAVISKISSPNAPLLSSSSSSSHHKHIAKKQHSILPNRMQNSSNVNVNAPNVAPVYVLNNSLHVKSEMQPQPEEDDDIPPGFGPSVARKDDDDLPEFNFSGNNVKSSVVPRIAQQNLHHKDLKITNRPVDQMRELIKKYGQSEVGSSRGSGLSDSSLGIEPWVDDDDIPEWRPLPHQILHLHDGLQVNQTPPSMTTHSPVGLERPPPGGGRWRPPHGRPHASRWRLN